MSARLDVGQYAIIRDLKHNTIVAARLLSGKRVRIETGDLFGETRNPGEFAFIEHVAHEKIYDILGQVWSD